MEDTNKTPQNINTLISEIGENMVLFKLFSIIQNRPNFEIFKNYSEPGYDIGIRNTNTNSKVKIEVKTRQHLVTTTADKSKNTCHFTLTENEAEHSDFLIGYWIDYNDFFIVPTSELSPTKNKKKLLYKLVFSRLKSPKYDLIYSEHAMTFHNQWEQIIEFAEGLN